MVKNKIIIDKVKVSRRFNELLDYFKLTQAQLSDRTDIPRSTLSRYVKGTRVPKQDGLIRIAKELGINPSWLMGLDVPMFFDDFSKSKQEREEEIKDIVYAYNKIDSKQRDRLMAYCAKLSMLNGKHIDNVIEMIDLYYDTENNVKR